MQITVWSYWDNKAKQYKHSHYESGHSLNSKPEPINTSSTNQLAWKNKSWLRQHTSINNHIIKD